MKNNDITAGSLLGVSGAYWDACALQAAVKLDLFSVLGDERRSTADVALAIGGDERATGTLLGAMAAMALLDREDEGWANTEPARKLLCKDGVDYIGHMLMHHSDMVESWHRLDQSVLTGAPTRDRKSHTSNADEREHFLMGMFNSAIRVAGSWSNEIDLAGRRCLLDFGGGPGTWAIHFCLANPSLRATVFDLPTTRPFAERTIARFGVEDRVEFQAGDFTTDEISGTYDVAWLSHILHGEGPEMCRSLVRKAAEALEPGGLIFIHEFILDDNLAGPLRPALFSLNMLVGTQEGRSYSAGQLREMLEAVGVSDLRRLPLVGPMSSGLIVGRV